MRKHGGIPLVEMLIQYGVDAVFGTPGGQLLPLYDGIRRNQDKIRHITLRDECNAAFAADAYARISGKVGVCDATAGCGSIKLASGLAESWNSSIPVVALIADMHSEWMAALHRSAGSQITDQRAVLRPLSKWDMRLTTTQRIPELVQRGFQMATSGRPGPVVLEFPYDLWDAEFVGNTPVVDARFGATPFQRTVPAADEIQKAVELLYGARRPVMLVGGGGWLSRAGEEVRQVAERFAMPVATTQTGKGILSERHPLSVGCFTNFIENHVAFETVKEADVVFAVGMKFSQNATFNWTIPSREQAVIHLDLDDSEIGKMTPVRVGLVGDAKAGLQAILDAGDRQQPTEPVIRILTERKEAFRAYSQKYFRHEVPILPQQVFKAVSDLTDENTILISDSSFAQGYTAELFESYGNRRAIIGRGNGALGYSVGGAIGAAAARPDAKIVVMAGDLGLSYCLGDLATLRQHNMNVTVVVLNNSTIGWIKWEQAAFYDGQFYGTDLSEVDFAGVAEGLGCKGYRVREPGDVNRVLTEALAHNGPSVVDVRTATRNEFVAGKFLGTDAKDIMDRAENPV